MENRLVTKSRSRHEMSLEPGRCNSLSFDVLHNKPMHKFSVLEGNCVLLLHTKRKVSKNITNIPIKTALILCKNATKNTSNVLEITESNVFFSLKAESVVLLTQNCQFHPNKLLH